MYNAYGTEGWNDEVLVGDSTSEPGEQVERLLRDAEVESKEGDVVKREVVERPMPRVSEADRRGDLRSLDRRLERMVYLVVKTPEGGWGFPGAVLERRESLHTVCLLLVWIMFGFADDCVAGRGTRDRSDGWCQYEYLGCREYAHWPPRPQLPASYCQQR